MVMPNTFIKHSGEVDFILLIRSIAMVRTYPSNPKGTKNVFSDIRVFVHTDICTFTLMFSHGNKYRVGQGAQ